MVQNSVAQNQQDLSTSLFHPLTNRQQWLTFIKFEGGYNLMESGKRNLIDLSNVVVKQLEYRFISRCLSAIRPVL